MGCGDIKIWNAGTSERGDIGTVGARDTGAQGQQDPGHGDVRTQGSWDTVTLRHCMSGRQGHRDLGHKDTETQGGRDLRIRDVGTPGHWVTGTPHPSRSHPKDP